MTEEREDIVSLLKTLARRAHAAAKTGPSMQKENKALTVAYQREERLLLKAVRIIQGLE